jgi:hypothetical protein
MRAILNVAGDVAAEVVACKDMVDQRFRVFWVLDRSWSFFERTVLDAKMQRRWANSSWDN